MVETRHQTRALTSQLLYLTTFVLALMLPFEIIQPVLSLKSVVAFTNLELLVLVTMGAWIIHFVTVRRVSRLNTPLTPPVLLFLLVAGVSAIAAPEFRGPALKYVTRFAFGIYTYFLIINVATSLRRIRGLVWAIIIGAGLSAFIGIGEAAGWPGLGSVLNLFKLGPTRVGGEIRVGATFQYATIAAMFFEMSIPLTLVAAVNAKSRFERGVAVSIGMACTVVVALTLTRAGMLSLLAVFCSIIALSWFRIRWRSLLRPTILVTLSLFATLGFLVTNSSAFLTRLTTENDLNWYDAAYSVPETLVLHSDDAKIVTIEITNTGQAVWTSNGENAFVLGYRLLSADGSRAFNTTHNEVSLPHDVDSQESVRLEIPFQTSAPAGTYRIAWGMLQREILWFRNRDVREAETVLHVERVDAGATNLPEAVPGGEDAAPTGEPESGSQPERPRVPPTVARLNLWRAAVQMFREHPLLGVGPDNYRHLYGRYLNMPDWDRRIHSNNLYLEILVNTGLVGLLVFGWLIAKTIHLLVLLINESNNISLTYWVIGLGGSLFAFLIHGLLDYFLSFVSTYLLFWMILGMIVSATQLRDV